jgi:hypothetical protein
MDKYEPEEARDDVDENQELKREIKILRYMLENLVTREYAKEQIIKE